MDLPKRKPNRLANFDYNQAGAYFLTICAKDRRMLFGSVVGGGAFDAPQIQLSSIGEIVEHYIHTTNHIPRVQVESFVIMPNHIHLLVSVSDADGTSRAPSPTNPVIPHLVSTLKRFVNRAVGEPVFQRSYYDHVIRNKNDYTEIQKYIAENPIKWQLDPLLKNEPSQ